MAEQAAIPSLLPCTKFSGKMFSGEHDLIPSQFSRTSHLLFWARKYALQVSLQLPLHTLCIGFKLDGENGKASKVGKLEIRAEMPRLVTYPVRQFCYQGTRSQERPLTDKLLRRATRLLIILRNLKLETSQTRVLLVRK